MKLNRRKFVKNTLSALAGLGLGNIWRNSKAQTFIDKSRLLLIGKVKPRTSKEISNSALGVGFETLDRKMFDPEKCYAALGDLGVKWARCQTGWNRCEMIRGEYTFDWLDEVVDNLIAVGVQPWFNVGYGNALYTPGAKNDSAVGWVPDNSDEAREAWQNFVRALAVHYKGRVNHYEIWNEPNGAFFWRPEKPSPDAYIALLKRTAKVLREVIPDAVIIGGAFDSLTSEFFERSLELGLAKIVDKISYHPYMLLPEKDYQKTVNHRRSTLLEYEPAPALWQGECGVPSTDFSVGALSKNKWNESRQARWLLRRLINDLRLKLEMISWYHTCDQKGYRLVGYEEGKSGAYFGLLRMDDYTPKPSYLAYQTMCSLFDSQTKAVESSTMKFDIAKETDTGSIEQAFFVRHAYLLCAYWLPVNVLEDTLAQAVNVTITVPRSLKLRTPVLIDPLNGQVFNLEGIKTNKQWSFSDIPVKDYPMLITDKDAFEIL